MEYLGAHLLYAVHSGGDGGGVIALLDLMLASIEDLFIMPSTEILPHLFPGIFALKNIHPLIVHFPIVLLSLFFLAEMTTTLLKVAQCRLIATWLLYAGTFFAGLTVLAGFQAANTVAHGAEVHEIMESHEHLAISVFGLACCLSLWRWLGKFMLHGAGAYIYLIVAGFLNILLLFTADFGGLMVYKYGVAVDAVSVQQNEEMNEHQHSH